MYENMTYAALLSEAKSYIGDGVQKGEGSLVFNALSVLAYELEKLYIQANYILNQSFADTADDEHLEAIAANRAIYRKAATAATVKIEADVPLSIGTRFSLKSYNYKVTDEIDNEQYIYAALCETNGTGPNELTGVLTPIDYVNGLRTAAITELLVAGEDAETREELYKRYLESFSTEGFAGNITAYKREVNAFAGVGGCKVFPVWRGPGTVRVVVIGADGRGVSEYLINEIREAAIPTTGTGYGFAPIDHDVTIDSVTEVVVNVTTQITYVPGYSWELLEEEIKGKIDAYLKSIASDWTEGTAETEALVYISRLEAAILEVTGVVDVASTTLNGSTVNLPLDADEIPVIGTVTAT